MTPLDYFNAVLSGKWITKGRNVQYRIENRILYLQGSSDKDDWRINFDFPVVPYKRMKELFFIHRGYLKAWKSIRDEIVAKFPEFDVIVGYSYGANVAIPIHEEFLYRQGYQPETYRYGGSKILFLPSRRIRSRFSRVTNIQNREDIVSMVVPLYSRVGKLVKLTKPLKRPEGFPRLEWLSGHTPQMYRMRLM